MDTDNTTPGFGEQAGAILTGYLSRLADVSIESRLAQIGAVTRAGTQNTIVNSPSTGMTASGLTISPNVLLMLAIGGAALFLALRKG